MNITLASVLTPPPLLLRRGFPALWPVIGRVADPDLGGGQVAVLRLHAASAGHVTDAAYSCLRECMCAMEQSALEHKGSAELRRTPLWRSSRWRESLHSRTPVGP